MAHLPLGLFLALTLSSLSYAQAWMASTYDTLFLLEKMKTFPQRTHYSLYTSANNSIMKSNTALESQEKKN